MYLHIVTFFSLLLFIACQQSKTEQTVATQKEYSKEKHKESIPDVSELSRRRYLMSTDTIMTYYKILKPVPIILSTQIQKVLGLAQTDILEFRKFSLIDSELLISINANKYDHSKAYLSLIRDSMVLDIVKITDSYYDVYDFKTVHSSLDQNENIVKLLIYKRGWIDDYAAGNTAGEYKVYQDSIYYYDINEYKISLIRSESGI